VFRSFLDDSKNHTYEGTKLRLSPWASAMIFITKGVSTRLTLKRGRVGQRGSLELVPAIFVGTKAVVEF